MSGPTLDTAFDGKPMLTITDVEQLRAWLDDNAATSTGLWLAIYKKNTELPSVSHSELVAELLCHGWVDSKARRLDEQRSMVWIAPRKRGSGWSRINKEHIERMVAQDRMRPGGIAAVEAAKADGSWTALDASERGEIPEDLAAALRAVPPAADEFAAFPPSVRKQILQWIGSAKRPETRSRRIAQTAELAAQGIRANQ